MSPTFSWLINALGLRQMSINMRTSSSCAQISSTSSRTRGFLWAWTETFTSLTPRTRTAGETTAASPPSQEYEPSFRRPPCLSSWRQVGVTSASPSSLKYYFPLKPAWCETDLFSERWSFPTCSLMSVFIATLQKPSKCQAVLFMCISSVFMLWFWSSVMFVVMFTRCPHVHWFSFFFSRFRLIHLHFRKKWHESWNW